MKKIIFIIYIIASFNLLSQASTTFGSGDFFHPLETSNIILKKLNLNIDFDSKNNLWKIHVYYHFYNSEKSKTERIQFISKSYTLDINKETIRNFVLKNSNEIVSMNYIKEEIEKDTSFNEIFSAEINFKKGDTYIENSYEITGTASAMPSIFTLPINYKSLNKWNRNIDIFYMKVNFDSLAILVNYNKDFEFLGFSKIGHFDNNDVIALKNSTLEYKKNNFIVQDYIELSIYDPKYIKLQTWFGHEISLYFTGFRSLSAYRSLLAKMSKSELRLLRNSIYAWHGYKFQSKELTEYFSNYIWYIPDSNNEIILSDLEKDNIKIIQEYE